MRTVALGGRSASPENCTQSKSPKTVLNRGGRSTSPENRKSVHSIEIARHGHARSRRPAWPRSAAPSESMGLSARAQAGAAGFSFSGG